MRLAKQVDRRTGRGRRDLASALRSAGIDMPKGKQSKRTRAADDAGDAARRLARAGLLIDRPLWGQGIVRILVISPFFIMPPVAALIWKNMFFNPTNGLFAEAAKAIGMRPFDFLGQAPLASIVRRSSC